MFFLLVTWPLSCISSFLSIITISNSNLRRFIFFFLFCDFWFCCSCHPLKSFIGLVWSADDVVKVFNKLLKTDNVSFKEEEWSVKHAWKNSFQNVNNVKNRLQARKWWHLEIWDGIFNVHCVLSVRNPSQTRHNLPSTSNAVFCFVRFVLFTLLITYNFFAFFFDLIILFILPCRPWWTSVLSHSHYHTQLKRDLLSGRHCRRTHTHATSRGITLHDQRSNGEWLF